MEKMYVMYIHVCILFQQFTRVIFNSASSCLGFRHRNGLSQKDVGRYDPLINVRLSAPNITDLCLDSPRAAVRTADSLNTCLLPTEYEGIREGSGKCRIVGKLLTLTVFSTITKNFYYRLYRSVTIRYADGQRN